MAVIATFSRPTEGPLEHAEAAWQRLHTPGTAAADRWEAAGAFAAACRAVEERGPAAIDPIARRAASTDPAESMLAEAAARILAEVGTIEAARALVRLALLTDAAVSRRALSAMPSMRVSQATQSLLVDAVHGAGLGVEAQRRGLLGDGLGRQLVTGPDFEATAWAASHPLAVVRCAWAKALARCGGPVASTYLRPLRDDQDAAVRAWAAFGLVLEGDTTALDELVRGARSRRSDERAAAVSLLGMLPLPDVLGPVFAAIPDRSPLVARTALLRAASLGTREALPALATQLDSRRADLVEQAAWSLRDLLGEDPGFAWSGRRLTPASAASVRARCRATHETWSPQTRHLGGRPLTAWTAAAAIGGVGATDPQAAFYTLLGMSQLSFGFDPAADMVANRDPIRKLRAWAAEHGRRLLPGGFYFRGTMVAG